MSTESTGPIRDLVGYGEKPPRPQFPGDANVAVNLVVNYEEGSEYSHFLGDGQNDSRKSPIHSHTKSAIWRPNQCTSTALGWACGVC